MAWKTVNKIPATERTECHLTQQIHTAARLAFGHGETMQCAAYQYYFSRSEPFKFG